MNETFFFGKREGGVFIVTNRKGKCGWRWILSDPEPQLQLRKLGRYVGIDQIDMNAWNYIQPPEEKPCINIPFS